MATSVARVDATAAQAAGGDFVQSLARGLTVIRAFDAEHPRLTLSEVARRTGLTRAAARRFLHTLVAIGYVALDGRHFSLRPRVLELGYAYLSSLGLPDMVRPHLEALSLRIGESSSASVLDGESIVYIARVSSRRVMSVDLGVGARLPAYATSMGRVMIAALPPGERSQHVGALESLTAHTITEEAELHRELDAVAEQGWALVDEELEEGLRSLAVGIRDPRGEVVAAINVSAPARQGSPEQLREALLPELRHTATEIEAELRLRGEAVAQP